MMMFCVCRMKQSALLGELAKDKGSRRKAVPFCVFELSVGSEVYFCVIIAALEESFHLCGIDASGV